MPKTAIEDGLRRLEQNFGETKSAPIALRLWEIPLLTREVLMAYVERLQSDQPRLSNRGPRKTVVVPRRPSGRKGTVRVKAPVPKFDPVGTYVVLYRREPVIWDGIDPRNLDHLTGAQRTAYFESLTLVKRTAARNFGPAPGLDFPPFDERGNVVLLDKAEDETTWDEEEGPFSCDCGAIREVEMEGNASDVKDFLAAAREASLVLDGLPDNVWRERLQVETRRASDHALRWIFCVFDLAWAKLLGSRLEPTLDKAIVTEKGSTVTHDLLSEIQDHRGHPGSKSRRVDLSDVNPDRPPRWFSCLDNAIDSSARAIRVLLDDLGCASRGRLKKDTGKAPRLRKKLKAPSKRKNDIIRALGLLEAFDADRRCKAAKVTKYIERSDDKKGSYKWSLNRLVKERLVESALGCDGGYWLSQAGRDYYDQLDQDGT